VLAAIAYHQPITRDGLKDIFGKEISRGLIGRLHARDLIGVDSGWVQNSTLGSEDALAVVSQIAVRVDVAIESNGPHA